MHGRHYTVVMKFSLGLAAVFAALVTALAAQQPTFRAGVTLVTTDVIPRDAQGRFVNDLQRENFTVTEDGQPQVISSFQMVHGPVCAAAAAGISVRM